MKHTLAALGVIMMLVAACGSTSNNSTLSADGAWARPTPAGATNGVVYLSVSSDIDDEIVGAQVPPAVAQSAELHTTMTDTDPAGHHATTGDGVMTMAEIESLPIGSATPVTFEPGGNHIMLVDISEPLETGNTFALTLTFASGRTLDTEVIVADNPPG